MCVIFILFEKHLSASWTPGTVFSRSWGFSVRGSTETLHSLVWWGQSDLVLYSLRHRENGSGSWPHEEGKHGALRATKGNEAPSLGQWGPLGSGPCPDLKGQWELREHRREGRVFQAGERALAKAPWLEGAWRVWQVWGGQSTGAGAEPHGNRSHGGQGGRRQWGRGRGLLSHLWVVVDDGSRQDTEWLPAEVTFMNWSATWLLSKLL